MGEKGRELYGLGEKPSNYVVTMFEVAAVAAVGVVVVDGAAAVVVV